MGKWPSHVLRDTIVFTIPDGVLFREQHLDKLKWSLRIIKYTNVAILIICNNKYRKTILTSFNVK